MLPVAVFAFVGLLAALWRFTPLAAWADGERMVAWATDFANVPWAPFIVLLAYTPACIVMFPRPLITLFAVAAFGAGHGFMYAFGGILIAAFVTFAVGHRLRRQAVRRIARGRLNRLSDVMRNRGILAMTAVRLVPLAPFAVVNVVAGAIRIRFSHFTIGSALGILPGTLVATVFGDQLVNGLRDPRAINVWLVVALFAAMLGATWLVRRWLFSSTTDARDAQRRSSA